MISRTRYDPEWSGDEDWTLAYVRVIGERVSNTHPLQKAQRMGHPDPCWVKNVGHPPVVRTHTLDNPTLPLVVQTFEVVFHRYHRHPESKSFAPDGTPCKTDSAGLLKRYPVTATGFHLIGKETERGWEQNDDVSTLMPSLVRYGSDTVVADEQLRKWLLEIPLAFLEFETGLSRHTIVRAR